MEKITPTPVDVTAVFENCRKDETGEFHYDYDPASDRIKPIPLLPDELRGVDIETCPDLEARYKAITAEEKVKETEILKLEYHPQAAFIIETSKRDLEPAHHSETTQDHRVLVPP